MTKNEYDILKNYLANHHKALGHRDDVLLPLEFHVAFLKMERMVDDSIHSKRLMLAPKMALR